MEFIKVDKKFHQEFDKIWKKSLLYALGFLLISILTFLPGYDYNVVLKITYIVLSVYYWCFFVVSMNTMANMNRTFNSWYRLYNLIKNSQYVFFTVWGICSLYLLYTMLQNSVAMSGLIIVMLNCITFYVFLLFWKDLDKQFYRQWEAYVPR